MSTLSLKEKDDLEKILKMEAGYVLSFSDSSFKDFFQESIGVDIGDEKYRIDGASKARRLRSFLKLEPDYLVANVLERLRERDSIKDSNLDQIINRLRKNQEINLDYTLLIDCKNGNAAVCFESIVRLVREGKPNEALDRLHTLAMGILNDLSGNKDKEKALHALYGFYIKNLDIDEHVRKILRAQQQVLEQLNDIRNNKSLAHPNPLLKDNDLAIYIIKITLELLEFLMKKASNKNFF